MSYDVSRRGKSWRARVRIHNGPSDSATVDTHKQGKEWAIATHAKLLAQHRPAQQAVASKPAAVDPASTPTKDVKNPLVSTVLKEYRRHVLPFKASHKPELTRIRRLTS